MNIHVLRRYCMLPNVRSIYQTEAALGQNGLINSLTRLDLLGILLSLRFLLLTTSSLILIPIVWLCLDVLLQYQNACRISELLVNEANDWPG